MSNSPQFQRTDKAILQAMVSLLKKKSFEKITVQDILDKFIKRADEALAAKEKELMAI